MSALLYFSVVIFGNLFLSNVVAEDPVVQLPKGKIRGHILESETGKPYYAFQEIPYAAPPVGNNRFQLPKEPEPWSDILNTTKNNVICYQVNVKYKNLKLSEDCLFINVYTPVVPGSLERLPVLVWIHGGGFCAESSTSEYYGPKYIVDHGVVVVTFNYRLGPFGFLTTDDDVIPANLGLKDPLLALEWVNQNIELFGGNSSHVTLDGESAGSKAVDFHLLGPWPNGKVLYHAAILQSGSTLYYNRSNDARTTAFGVGYGIDNTFSSNDSTELLKLLQKAPAENILKVASPAPWPIVEKTGPFAYHLFDCLENGNIKKVPIIIGFNSEEWIYDVLNKNVEEEAAALDEDPMKMFGSQFNLSSTNRSIAGNLLKRIYTETTFQDNLGAYIRFDSDSRTCTPTTKQAELQSRFVDVYLYQFSYKGPLGGQMSLPDVAGAEHVGHAEDLKYFWDDETNSDLTRFPAEDQLMLHRYAKMWTNFVKYHNPTPVKDPLLQNINWTKVDPKQPGNIQYLNMNRSLEMLSNPRYYQKVKKVLDHYITPDIIIWKSILDYRLK